MFTHYSAEIRRGSPGGTPRLGLEGFRCGSLLPPAGWYYGPGMPVVLALALLTNRHRPLVQVGEHLLGLLVLN
jgi:hypothetical protein